LLKLEHVLVEFLLQLLVGVVDAELFEAVLGEMFKPVDIENANEALHLRDNLGRAEEAVHGLHKPVEERRVDVLGHGVAHNNSLGLVQVGHDLFTARDELLLDRPFCEVGRVDAQKLASLDKRLLVRSK